MARWLWLLLALVASVASGQRLTTFAWDAGTDWPHGTTVELCGNGDVCRTVITGTQATLDLPVQPGEAIHGRARAVAPSGYQCGNPPAPCPYSDWATVTQTWPLQAIGGWARHERREQPMAIEYLGYVVVDNTGDISQAITVPSNTNYALIFRGGWTATAQSVTSITLDGTAATQIRTVAVSDDYQDFYLYGVPVSSGSKTLVHNLSGTFSEGGKVTVVFFSGVDTANPSIDSNYSQYGDAYLGTDAPTWALSSVADGIGAVFISAYNNGTSLTLTSQSQTSIFNNITYNSNIYGLGYKTTSSSSTTFGCSVTANQRYWSAVAVTLRPSSISASLPPVTPFTSYAHLIVR